jgi:hypothetical protein
MINLDDLLPIGTVVMLKKGQKEVMVAGYRAVDVEGKVYDYIGVGFPEGFVTKDYALGFNHDEIKDIIFKGLENEKTRVFFEDLKDAIKNIEATDQE